MPLVCARILTLASYQDSLMHVRGEGNNTCLRICNIVVVIIDLNVLGFVEMYVYVIVVVQQ